jgi:hypothetical protein
MRTRWRAPDDLGAALVAFGRAVRAQRRLARLAPRFFDSATVDDERRQRDAQRRWMAEWEPILSDPVSSTSGVPAAPAPSDPNPDAASAPLPASPSVSIGNTSAALVPGPPSAVAPGASHVRRDAWSGWARQIRRLHRTR